MRARLLPITNELLALLDSSVPSDVEWVEARDPVVCSIVRKGGSGEFASVTVRLAGSKPLLLDARALDRLAALTRVPKNLLADLPDELIRSTLNAQLRKHWSWFACAAVKGEHVVDWLAPGWRGLALKPSDVASTCARALGDQPCLGGQPEGEWPRLRLLFTDATLSHVFTGSPRADDRHRFYLGVEMDFAGWEMPSVSAVSYRLACSNGMMVLASHPGSERKLWAQTRTVFLDKLRAASVAAVDYIRSVLIPRIECTVTRSAALETVLAYLPERIAPLVRSGYRAEDLGGSEYHVVNALSRAANRDDCPPEWRDRLRSLAGELAVGRRCWSCFRKK